MRTAQSYTAAHANVKSSGNNYIVVADCQLRPLIQTDHAVRALDGGVRSCLRQLLYALCISYMALNSHFLLFLALCSRGGAPGVHRTAAAVELRTHIR